MTLVRKIGQFFDLERSFKRDIIHMNRLKNRNSRFLLKIHRFKMCRKYSCYISPQATIHDSVEFPHPTGIVIGAGSYIGPNCVIYQGVTLGRRAIYENSYPFLDEGCIVYAGAQVIGGVHLGKGTLVGANAVVMPKDKVIYESGEVLVGVPARAVRKARQLKYK